MASVTKLKLASGIRYRARVVRKGGKPISRNFSTATTAKKWAAEQEKLLDDSRLRTSTKAYTVTLSDLMDHYIETTNPASTKVSHLEWWRSELGYKYLADILPEDVSEGILKLQRGHKKRGGNKVVTTSDRLSPATVNRYHTSLSAVLTYAMRKLRWIDHNVARDIDKLEENNERVRWLRGDELESLLNACDNSEWKGLSILVRLALATGARKGELLGLKWSDIDLDKGEAYLENTKNGDRRTLAIVSPVLKRLHAWKAQVEDPNGYVFPSEYYHGKARTGFAAWWSSALDEAGVDDFRFHDLRHTCASYLTQAGIPSLTVSKILGHKTASMTKRYAHLDTADQHHALAKVFG